MQAPISYRLRGQQLWLSSHRTIFWEEEKALIVSDLHFGKTGHFRKWGIPVPQGVYKNDLQRLVGQLQYFQPKQLIVVGDLFHSHQNKELELFRKWRLDLPDLDIRLIKGNHDILHERWYQETNISVSAETLSLRDLFGFTHDLTPGNITATSEHYYFSGHLHPGIRINGQGKQSLSFPCFYFTERFCVLPAFSEFTGLAMIRPTAGENVFAIVNNAVMQLQ
ncbi:MAG: ligase-associated DNA damage response endonuclease PdeM [Candidatus Pseudobacter hemicellulosilyticus]|uniref:Ligase-associated DNA damage response endonuclease PdeM n=1 Tax=Candidatus Pseudobacter hemicellulosilyticus TaxID=3121375 RepID=A0AAJ5WS29_9BACT|nr:MAG: ligase-associated DNA damage response endonuclease PdeM [Pseudobacter sp.]